MVMQCLGAICGAGTVKWLQKGVYENNGGGASAAAAAMAGYAKGNGLSAEILATFLFVGIAFYTTHPKTRARGSRFPIAANLPIAFTVFLFHPIKIGTGINPANLPIGWLVPADSGRERRA